MRLLILVVMAFVLVFSVLGILLLLLRLTNIERVQRGESEDLSLDANRTRRSPMDHKRNDRPPPMDMHDFLPGDVYHRFPQIQEYLKDLARRHPEVVQVEQLGLSHEGRAIWMVKIGRGAAGELTPSMLVDGGMHAREWVTVGTALSLIGHLVKLFTTAEDCARLPLTGINWHIIPVLNPDGYEYSATTDRLWRKNRRPPPTGSTCAGVDLNRNFPLGFGLGADAQPCSEVYKGLAPLSEPESQALQLISGRLNSSLLAYISLHAYGQSWLTPWGYQTKPLPNSEELEEVAKEAFRQVDCSFGRAVPAREYEVGGAAKIYYVAGGSSDDFVYSTTKTRLAYTIELPDDGREFGFLLPPSKLPQVAADTWVALRSVGLQALARMSLTEKDKTG